MTRAIFSLAALLLAGVAILPAATSCAGECSTVEYRIDSFYESYHFVYNRADNGYYIEETGQRFFTPKEPMKVDGHTGGTPNQWEKGEVARLRNQARKAMRAEYQIALDQWANRTADAGTTNTCSAGCICAEGKFTETTGTCGEGSSEFYEKTVTVGGRTWSYACTWASKALLNYTRRSKIVPCVALEP